VCRLGLTALFAAAALALAAAALGALSPSDYRAQASAACAKANKQGKALGLDQPKTSAAEVEKSVAAALAINRQRYATLRALQPPASLAAAHRRALGIVAQEISLVAGEVKQMQAGTAPFTVLAKSGATGLRLLIREASAWGAAGVAVCSSGGFDVSTG
jgi:hypothetical protein